MPTWTTDDKTALMNSGDGFSDSATYGVTTIYGALENPFLELNPEGIAVESRDPAFLCKASDVSTVAQGSAITVSGTAYTVSSVEPDGTGLVRLQLRKT